MTLLLFIFAIILIGLFIFVNKMYNNGMLSKKQYNWYILLIFITSLFLCGQLNILTNTNY